MAKRKRRRSRRRRIGMGSTIRVRRLDGLGAMNRPGSLIGASIPPVLGAGTAALTTIGIRQIDAAPAALVQYSPWVGLGASALVAAIMYNTFSRPAGVATLAAGFGATLAIVISEWLAKEQAKGGGTKGFGAIVPEYGMGAIVPEYAGGTDGLGSIVMEPHASRGYGAGPLGGSYGETVNLGSINTDVFGTSAFKI